MNISEIARRLHVSTEELREQLPALGFSIGGRAIKVNDREAHRIIEAWKEMKRRERLTAKRDEQKAKLEKQKAGSGEQTEQSVTLPAVTSVRDFASRLDLPIARVMQVLMKNGILASINERIDFDTAAIVAADLGFEAVPETEDQSSEEDLGVERLEQVMSEEKKGDLTPRPPVIVIMGHVDHGKTKLLDSIRTTNVVDTEAGGITQHIGAYQVERNKKLITFIDTPGHEAFTVMRSRGAKVADIAILVIAADDGVQPQTKEAVDIIKAAKLPYVVALNKIDKPEANIDRVKGELAELGLVPEDWGGKTICVPVSAKEGTGIDDVLDSVLLVADVEQESIVANPNRRAIGTVIESHVDKGQGPVATVLVQVGTLKPQDSMGIQGALYGRVRSMKDWRGNDISDAGPSTPVRILGFKAAPAVGDVIEVPEQAKSLQKLKKSVKSASEEAAPVVTTQQTDEAEEKQNLNVIVRADVLGSLEAFLGMLEKVKHDLVGVEVVSKGLGNITDADILQAEATKSVVYAFNVRPTGSAEELARDKEVTVVQSPIIYKLFEDTLERLQELLPAEHILTEMGKVEVLAAFKKTSTGGVIGGKVRGDAIEVGATIRVLRDEQVVGEAKITRLQSGKQDVKSVPAGAECGIEYEGKAKIEVGDVLESYTEEQKHRKLAIEGVDLR